MEMFIDEEDGLTKIALVGRLDLKGADKIDMRFSAVAGIRPKVAVDLSQVDYIASMGIRTFVMSGKTAAQRQNKLVLFGADESVHKVITTSGLDQIVTVVADWEAARAYLA